MFSGLRVLLDTQVFIELVQDGLDAVSPQVRKVVAAEQTELLLSAVSLTEIAIKAALGKLVFSRKNVALGIQQLRLIRVPYTPDHAERLFDLPRLEGHKDPFSRMLIATALVENVPLVSSDAQFKRYTGLKVIR